MFTCVQRKADAMARMSMMISTAEDLVVETGPLVELSLSPNPAMTWRAFIRATSAYLDLTGRAAWKIDAPAGVPVAVWPLVPSRLRPDRDRGTGRLLGWKYHHAGGKTEPFTVEEVHYFCDPDFEAGDTLEGLAPRAAVAMAIDQYYKADLANISSLDNGVEPTGALRAPDTLTEAQIGLLRQELRDHHAGVLNRKQFMLLMGGLEWQQMGAAFKDMEFIAGKEMAREDICSAYGVPPAVAGFYKDSNYAHADAAERIFWTGTILPRAEWIAEEWTRGVLDRFAHDRTLAVVDARRSPLAGAKSRHFMNARRRAVGTGQRYFGWMDAGGVEAVQRANLAIVDEVEKWVGLGVTLNDALRATNAPFQEVPWGDTWHRPAGLIDVRTQLEEPATPDDDVEVDQKAPEDGLSRRLASGAGTDTPEARNASEAILAGLWEKWRASWRGLEVATRNKVRRHFNELRGEMLRRLDAELPPEVAKGGADLPGVQRRDLLGRLLFDLVDADGKVEVRIGPLIREAFELGGKQAVQEAADAGAVASEDGEGEDASNGPQSPFNIEAPEVAAKLRRRKIKLSDMNRTLRRKLATTLADALDAGETRDQIAERIKGQFNIAHRRAAGIAQNEISASVEEARHEGHKQAGVPLKSWLHSRKETGRPEHRRTEEATTANPIPMDERYTIAGTDATCLHPRGTGRPEQDINCGCTSIARYPGDTIKAVAARYARRGFLTYSPAPAPGNPAGGSLEGKP